MFSKQSKFRGFNAHGMVAASMLVYMLISVIVGVGVVLPIIENLTTVAGLTGITGTIVSYLSTFVAIGILLSITSVFG